MAGTRPHSQDVGSQAPNASTRMPPRSSLWMTTLRTLRVAELVLAHVPGSALLLKTSFSKRVRRVDPYVSFFYRNRGSTSAPSEGVGTFNLADEWGTFFGSEVAFEMTKPVFRVSGCDFNMEGHTRRFAVHEYSSGMSNSQETNMIRKFAQIVLSRQLEPKWGDNVLRTQQVLDACLHSAREDGKLVSVS